MQKRRETIKQNAHNKHTLFLEAFKEEMKIELWYEVDVVNGNTMIQGVCVRDGCETVFSRRIDYLLKSKTLTCETHCKEEAPIKHAKTSMKNWGVSNPTKIQLFNRGNKRLSRKTMDSKHHCYTQM